MIKRAPSTARLLVIAIFALSSVGLSLYLWLTFGGSVPFAPHGYRVQVAFPQASFLVVPTDVRVSGLTVGKVVATQLDAADSRTRATLEIYPQYTPLASSARATLRSKTLLGERYVEITLGRPGGPAIPDGGRLPDGQIQSSVQLDQVLSTYDASTRRAFQTWQQSQAAAAQGQGRNLNDAIGNLPGFESSGTRLLSVLNGQAADVQSLVRNTGVVFASLSSDQTALRNLITSSDQVFGATSAENRALSRTFEILPVFLDHAKSTLQSIQTFSAESDPLIQDLRPAIAQLPATLLAGRALAPVLRVTFARLRLLIGAGRVGLPALRATLDQLRPLLGQVQPFLEQLNPVLQWVEYLQETISGALGALPATLGWKAGGSIDGLPGHVFPILTANGPDNVLHYADRPANARGNSYFLPAGWASRQWFTRQIPPSFDCNNTGLPGDGSYQTQLSNTNDAPSCWLQPAPPVPLGNTSRLPHIEAADYGSHATRTR